MGRNQLSQDEIRSLLHGVDDVQQQALNIPHLRQDGGHTAPGPDRAPHELDQAPRGRNTREDLTDADAWTGLQKLVDCVRGALSEHLRASLQVELVSVQRMPCRDFLERCRQPTFLATSVAAGDNQEIALDFGLAILFPAINRMLGGRFEDEPIASRPLTRIETGLASRLADRIVGVLLAACGEAQPGRWKTSTEDRALAYHPAPREQGSMACFDLAVNLGPACGPLRVALPWEMFQRQAGQCQQAAPPDPDAVSVSVVLAATRVPRSELADLQPGDVVASQLSLGQLFEVHLDGCTRYHGSLGALDGNKAVRIERTSDTGS